MQAIEAANLTKAYGDFVAVSNVSLQVSEGEIYGFLGLNGAGKTTTIRMLLDMIKPSAGDVKLFGKKLKSGDTQLNRVGYLVETPNAYPDLTVIENLQVYFDYRGLKDHRLLDSIIDGLDLYKYRNVRAKHLSMGNKQRLGLAKALFHEPRLLILDEPTNGLDPAGIVEIRNLLKRLSTEGVTVFISSHILGEIAKSATRIGIIHEGKLIREILINDLEVELKKDLVIKTNDINKSLNVLSSHGYTFSPDKDGIQTSNEIAINESETILSLLVNSGVRVTELIKKREDLESYFLRQIGKEVDV